MPEWFTDRPKGFRERVLPLAGTPGLMCLQIGAWVGDVSVWLGEEVLTGEGSMLHDVDPWGLFPGMYRAMDAWERLHQNYLERTDGMPVTTHRTTSDIFFAHNPDLRFDFIYMDGDHTKGQTDRDLVNSWNSLKPGGVMGIDDYRWAGNPPGDNPRDSIDPFLRTYQGQYADLMITDEVDGQVWFRKI